MVMSQSLSNKRALLMCAFILTGAATPGMAVENQDFLLLVDIAPKAYRLHVDEPGYARWDDRGTFSSNVLISPTIRIHEDGEDNKPSLMITAGLSYGHSSTTDLKIDTIEWQLGVGAWWRLTEWVNLSMHAQGGTGISYVDLPDVVNLNYGREDGWQRCMHGEALATVIFSPYPNLLFGVTGGARVMYQSSSVSDGSRTTFSNVISGGVLAGSVGFTF